MLVSPWAQISRFGRKVNANSGPPASIRAPRGASHLGNSRARGNQRRKSGAAFDAMRV
jgi:hypothetical protein